MRGGRLPADCVLSSDNLLTVPKALLVERITTLRGERLAALCSTLEIATGCD